MGDSRLVEGANNCVSDKLASQIPYMYMGLENTSVSWSCVNVRVCLRLFLKYLKTFIKFDKN